MELTSKILEAAYELCIKRENKCNNVDNMYIIL